jgi:hypothetical protein
LINRRLGDNHNNNPPFRRVLLLPQVEKKLSADKRDKRTPLSYVALASLWQLLHVVIRTPNITRHGISRYVVLAKLTSAIGAALTLLFGAIILQVIELSSTIRALHYSTVQVIEL